MCVNLGNAICLDLNSIHIDSASIFQLEAKILQSPKFCMNDSPSVQNKAK